MTHERHIIDGEAWVFRYVNGKQTGACRWKDKGLLGLTGVEVVFLALVGFVPPGFIR